MKKRTLNKTIEQFRYIEKACWAEFWILIGLMEAVFKHHSRIMDLSYLHFNQPDANSIKQPSLYQMHSIAAVIELDSTTSSRWQYFICVLFFSSQYWGRAFVFYSMDVVSPIRQAFHTFYPFEYTRAHPTLDCMANNLWLVKNHNALSGLDWMPCNTICKQYYKTTLAIITLSTRKKNDYILFSPSTFCTHSYIYYFVAVRWCCRVVRWCRGNSTWLSRGAFYGNSI